MVLKLPLCGILLILFLNYLEHMAKTKKTTAKADIDFEQQLWDAANELRGAVAENQYKDYVLSLLFARHLSERYAERKEELITLASDEQSEYFTKKQKRTGAASQ